VIVTERHSRHPPINDPKTGVSFILSFNFNYLWRHLVWCTTILGDSSPSRADIEITRAVAEAGRRLGITVHDHIILGTDGHTSLRAQGLI